MENMGKNGCYVTRCEQDNDVVERRSYRITSTGLVVDDTNVQEIYHHKPVTKEKIQSAMADFPCCVIVKEPKWDVNSSNCPIDPQRLWNKVMADEQDLDLDNEEEQQSTILKGLVVVYYLRDEELTKVKQRNGWIKNLPAGWNAAWLVSNESKIEVIKFEFGPIAAPKWEKLEEKVFLDKGI